jgi:hypothetical protein
MDLAVDLPKAVGLQLATHHLPAAAPSNPTKRTRLSLCIELPGHCAERKTRATVGGSTPRARARASRGPGSMLSEVRESLWDTETGGRLRD